MNEEFAKLFGLIKKDKDLAENAFSGDDIHMKSVAKYGIPSGIPQLDLYLGYRGGLPAGKVIEYYGAPMVGKTTIALQSAAEWQKRGGIVIFIDSEQSWSPLRAREVGLIPEQVIKHEVDTVEQAFEAILKDLEHLKTAKVVKPVLFILDSVTGVPTEADAKGDIDDSDRPGFEAKQIKRGVRKVNPHLGELECRPSIIFINHIHSTFNSFGRKSDSSGGKGVKYYASVRLELINMGQLKDGDRRIGQKVKIRIEKLKGGHLEYPTFNVNLTNSEGFDKIVSLHDAMVATGYADRPKGSKVTTILTGTDKEEQFKNVDVREWIESKGGYDAVYKAWRDHAIKNGTLQPWGNET